MLTSVPRGRSVAPPARRSVDPQEIAARLAPAIRWPGAPDVEERSWRLVALTPEFDAWVIAWPRGGSVDLHAPGRSRGALVVLEGALVETTPWRDDTGRLTLRGEKLAEGSTRRFARGHVHDVRNVAESTAVSLHVYHPPLTSMTSYELAGNQLVRSAVHHPQEWDGSAAASSDDAGALRSTAL